MLCRPGRPGPTTFGGSVHRVLRPALLAGLAAVVLVMAGCSGEVRRGNGPLQMGGDGGELCIPFGTGRDLTYGDDALRNSSPVPVTIESLSLFRPHDVRLVDARLLPIENTTLIGSWSQWPPVNPEATRVWSKGVKAQGAHVARSQGDLNLVLHLVATSRDAGFEAVHVKYSIGTRTFVASTSIRFRVKQSCFDPDIQ